MKRWIGVAAATMSLAAVAVACGGDDGGESSASTAAGAASTTEAASALFERGLGSDCASAETFCVGLVTDVGKVDDKSFNQSAWEGAVAAAEALGGEADYIETTDSKDYGANIKSFLDRNADAIITVGFALGEETTNQAKSNPGTKFIGVDQFQETTVPNVTGLIFEEDKAGFMAGALAGLMTETNTVAAVLGTDQVPPVVAYGKGWENGAKFTNPEVRVITTYHPGGLDVAFTDPAWGGTTAKQALDNNADVVFGAGGKTGNGALIEVAKKSGAYCVGVDSDQWETVPEAHPCLVTSAMKLIDKGVTKLLTDAQGGSLEGGNFTGEVALAPFHDLEAKVPADVQKQIEKIVAEVQAGTQPTGVD